MHFDINIAIKKVTFVNQEPNDKQCRSRWDGSFFEPSYLDLHCLHKYLSWSTVLVKCLKRCTFGILNITSRLRRNISRRHLKCFLFFFLLLFVQKIRFDISCVLFPENQV